jgi:hypothetical protein
MKIKEYKKGNLIVEIHQDEQPENPRDWDNLGIMICHHNRYKLGDKHNINPNDYNSFKEMKKDIIKEYDVAVMLPLYLYDHSGITISTSPFNCPWDSGQVGFIVISKKKIREEFSVKRITKKIKENITKTLESEVKTYDQFLTGDIYGFKILKDGIEIDSCWGFYGSDINTNGMLNYIDEPEFADMD